MQYAVIVVRGDKPDMSVDSLYGTYAEAESVAERLAQKNIGTLVYVCSILDAYIVHHASTLKADGV